MMGKIKDKVFHVGRTISKTSTYFFRRSRMGAGNIWSVIRDYGRRFLGNTRSRKRALRGFVQSIKTLPKKKHRMVSVDVGRRTFLKYAVFGGVVFLAGKYFGPFMNMMHGDTVLNEKTFNNFKITETGKQIQVIDDDGDEILVIDKEGY